jgi:hypothetical protein
MRSVAEECLRADRETKTKLLDYLETMITEQRKEKFGEVLRNRTRFITIVLEDIFSPIMPAPFCGPATASGSRMCTSSRTGTVTK